MLRARVTIIHTLVTENPAQLADDFMAGGITDLEDEFGEEATKDMLEQVRSGNVERIMSVKKDAPTATAASDDDEAYDD